MPIGDNTRRALRPDRAVRALETVQFGPVIQAKQRTRAKIARDTPAKGRKAQSDMRNRAGTSRTLQRLALCFQKPAGHD